ncbi:CIA30 family protein [Palleronia caenipelagi]|uniref:NADH:ubiquinone oxidoreductase complex i intermediate-associated protein 30 n=1 Tax=Palleronia caenipelagi TaxID=2489174 RepID=A0A547Q741_9RHOB|nr:CIA30 family protein [Palleronia caenipelagi]TRD22202.1 NADH:ubiquinone oxidoreductase complex i intermediate-associated protein 30 [Palleronia caenipelagi]
MTELLFDGTDATARHWELVSDRVMGGISNGRLKLDTIAGRAALHLTGTVSLENDGGFLQMARDLPPGTGWNGIALTVRGTGECYDIRLRTRDLSRPWQSFRTEFTATDDWQELRIAFADLTPHRTDVAFRPEALSRVGLVGVGRAFEADLALAEMRFYR